MTTVLELESQRADEVSDWIKAKGTPIISFAIWERKGDTSKALDWERERREGPDKANCAKSVLDKERLELDFPGGRRDAPFGRKEACEKSLEEADRDFSTFLSSDRLQMELVCTYPCFQRRGAASTLVQWGVRKAIQEEVKFITAAASPCGLGLYKKNGFRYLKERKSRKVEHEGEATVYKLVVKKIP
ncbi:hypothetical protein GP486_006569 [Trichoglossum hirsutum]|uniref:N-acetyltransferase domain-containing protein n=1 Tax=Trichoglossum hirsutum TaxID=265104 RepID=A0A9P8IE92_9PEZI|nr:hypothetical protein GP486_006569 [Trichoglossum hirsutum]